jgi:hypothetical protein
MKSFQKVALNLSGRMQTVNWKINHELQENTIEGIIARKITDELHSILKDRRVDILVDEVRINQEEEYATGRSYFQVYIKIVTDNRPLIMGQFCGMPIGGMSGLFNHYLQGFVKSYLLTLSNFSNKNICVFVDVWQEPMKEITVVDLVRVEAIEDVLEEGLLSNESPLTEYSLKYNFKFISLIGADISGPEPGMIKVIENFIIENNPKRILDLFCGTAAYSKVALSLDSNCKSTALDLYTIPYAKKNVGKYIDRIKFLEMDAYDFEPKNIYDVAIVDPYGNISLEFTKKKVKSLSHTFRNLIFSIGYTEYFYWGKMVKEALKNFFPEVRIINE